MVAVSANAQSTDITGVIGQLGGYATAGIGVGIAVLLFVLGRCIVSAVVDDKPDYFEGGKDDDFENWYNGRD